MFLRATAKINLCLDVLRKRPDGYHDVRMVMQMVGMYDRLIRTADRAGLRFQSICRIFRLTKTIWQSEQPAFLWMRRE